MGCGLMLLLVFGAEIGPLSAVHPCPSHSSDAHDGTGDVEAPHALDHAEQAAHAAHGDGDSAPGAHGSGTDHEGPCDCLGHCLTCGVSLPAATGEPPASASAVLPALDGLASLLHTSPYPFLAPDANPPPALALV